MTFKNRVLRWLAGKLKFAVIKFEFIIDNLLNKIKILKL